MLTAAVSSVECAASVLDQLLQQAVQQSLQNQLTHLRLINEAKNCQIVLENMVESFVSTEPLRIQIPKDTEAQHMNSNIYRAARYLGKNKMLQNNTEMSSARPTSRLHSNREQFKILILGPDSKCQETIQIVKDASNQESSSVTSTDQGSYMVTSSILKNPKNSLLLKDEFSTCISKAEQEEEILVDALRMKMQVKEQMLCANSIPYVQKQTIGSPNSKASTKLRHAPSLFRKIEQKDQDEGMVPSHNDIGDYRPFQSRGNFPHNTIFIGKPQYWKAPQYTTDYDGTRINFKKIKKIPRSLIPDENELKGNTTNSSFFKTVFVEQRVKEDKTLRSRPEVVNKKYDKSQRSTELQLCTYVQTQALTFQQRKDSKFLGVLPSGLDDTVENFSVALNNVPIKQRMFSTGACGGNVGTNSLYKNVRYLSSNMTQSFGFPTNNFKTRRTSNRLDNGSRFYPGYLLQNVKTEQLEPNRGNLAAENYKKIGYSCRSIRVTDASRLISQNAPPFSVKIQVDKNKRSSICNETSNNGLTDDSLLTIDECRSYNSEFRKVIQINDSKRSKELFKKRHLNMPESDGKGGQALKSLGMGLEKPSPNTLMFRILQKKHFPAATSLKSH